MVSHRAVFHGFGILVVELALGEAHHAGFMGIEIDRVLLAHAIQNRGIAKTSAPLDQVLGWNAVDGHFR